MAERLVVLDTNALLLPFTDSTDLEDELVRLLGAVRFIVPASTRDELATLAEAAGQLGHAARAAQRLAGRWGTGSTDLPGDDGLLDVARRLDAAVVTNDKRLQGEATRSGLTVVASRGKGRLALVGQ